jgi:small GTP-binding protein
MLQLKVCVLGAFGVGKTSLVARFVTSIFSDKYLTTVGVKIAQKAVHVDSRDVNLILWDIQGEDEFYQVRPSYLRGASGALLVADGTRKDTLDTAIRLRETLREAAGGVPSLLLLNKNDLTEEWGIEEEVIAGISRPDQSVLRTSAKTGLGVDDAFLRLTRSMLAVA